MNETQTPAKFTPDQLVTLRDGPLLRYALVSTVRWSRSRSEYRYAIRILCGDHAHTVKDIPERALRIPRTLGEPKHIAGQVDLGTLERVELDGVEVEGVRMSDGSLVYIV